MKIKRGKAGKTKGIGNSKAAMLIVAGTVIIALSVIIFLQIREEQLPPVSREYDQLVLGESTATKAQAERWAKRNRASDLFLSWIDLYWELGEEYGVNPVVAYTQAALETGFAKFGSVLDASYFNPCGLKTAEGGDDTDADAHHRFSSWEEGIRAHYEHLALYAGAEGYPLEHSVDPRHFPYLTGIAETVGGVSESWATAGTYADDWTYLINRLEVTNE